MVYVGTSGYNYPEWRGTFYPERLPAKEMFGFYVTRFRTVEINATFYRMPTVKTTTGWLEQAPHGFKYALKAPRQITHIKRLRECDDAVRFFYASARVLGAHLGPVLFQLPPQFKADLARLSAFLRILPGDVHTAFEFRHESWLTTETYALLREHGAALCIADVGDRTTPLEATARHGYLRLRDEGYTPADLERWAIELVSHAVSWDETYVFFKHEEEGKGPEFAQAFLDMLKARGVQAALPPP
jgi:uncharacterized protein YecE (DUF72 family)